MVVHHIENSNSLRDIVDINELVVVDFSAVWCGPCKRIAPVFEKLSNQFTNWVFCKVDVDLVSDAAEKYSVCSLPTFVFLKNGTVVHRFEGDNVDALTKALQSI